MIGADSLHSGTRTQVAVAEAVVDMEAAAVAAMTTSLVVMASIVTTMLPAMVSPRIKAELQADIPALSLPQAVIPLLTHTQLVSSLRQAFLSSACDVCANCCVCPDGGYQAYLAMWYQAIAAQQGQGGQGGPPQGPPGA